MDITAGPQTTDTRLVPTARAFVVWDKATGEIVHVHHCVTFASGADERESPQARARRMAGAKDGADVEVLEVDPTAINHRRPIRVDPATRTIVPR